MRYVASSRNLCGQRCPFGWMPVVIGIGEPDSDNTDIDTYVSYANVYCLELPRADVPTTVIAEVKAHLQKVKSRQLQCLSDENGIAVAAFVVKLFP